MSAKSEIEWTDATWNPVRCCTKISPGCAHCYAETFAERFRGVSGHPYEQGFDLSRVMQMADWHTYQVLTKRAERMCELLSTRLAFAAHLPHIWWGVSVENRKHGVPRIGVLRETPAAVRFMSIEPLLEDLGQIDLRGIDWVIVGGESGFGARPMERSWVVGIRKQCRAANVPFFFKQWGGLRKSEAGRDLDGQTYDEMPCRQPGRVASQKVRLALIDDVQSWDKDMQPS